MNLPPVPDEAAAARLEEAVKELRERKNAEPAEPEPEVTTPENAVAFVEAVTDKLATMTPRSDEEVERYSVHNNDIPTAIKWGFSRRHLIRLGDSQWGEPRQYRTFEEVRKGCAGVGAIIVLLGPRGVGKTMIAAQLALDELATKRKLNEEAALEPEAKKVRYYPLRKIVYTKLVDLIARFKPLYADYGTINIEALLESRENYVNSIKVLVIDEVHECQDQKFKHIILTDLVDRFYAVRHDVILISNETPESFKKNAGGSLLSRLQEHGDIFLCTWKSWRAHAVRTHGL